MSRCGSLWRSLVLLLPACAPADTDPPDLTDAELVDGRTLRLTFTEGIADPSAIDPSLFRLSLAIAYDDATVYYALGYDFEGLVPDTTGGYADDGPAATGDTGYDPTGYDPTGYDPPGDDGYDDGYDGGGYDGGVHDHAAPLPLSGHPLPLHAAGDVGVREVRSVPGSTDRVDLVLELGVRQTEACAEIAAARAEGADAAIFLHSRQPDVGGVVDGSANQLAPLAEHWVIADQKAYVEIEGHYPEQVPLLPLECP